MQDGDDDEVRVVVMMGRSCVRCVRHQRPKCHPTTRLLLHSGFRNADAERWSTVREDFSSLYLYLYLHLHFWAAAEDGA